MKHLFIAVMIFAAVVVSSLFATTHTEMLPLTDKDADVLAAKILESKEHKVTRTVALLMDNSQELREAIKRYVVKNGWMYGYQATRFDDGFGACVRAL